MFETITPAPVGFDAEYPGSDFFQKLKFAVENDDMFEQTAVTLIRQKLFSVVGARLIPEIMIRDAEVAAQFGNPQNLAEANAALAAYVDTAQLVMGIRSRGKFPTSAELVAQAQVIYDATDSESAFQSAATALINQYS